MDSWNEKQLKMMSLGGNKTLQEFFAQYDLNEEPAAQRYKTKASDVYRQKVFSRIKTKTYSSEKWQKDCWSPMKNLGMMREEKLFKSN